MIIRMDEDTVLDVVRTLQSHTTQEDAVRIHESIGTDVLVRGRDGSWYCCDRVKDVAFFDGSIIKEFDQLGLS